MRFWCFWLALGCGVSFGFPDFSEPSLRCALALSGKQFRAAVWYGPCDSECLQETFRHFEPIQPNLRLSYVSTRDILSGALRDYQALLIPGGYSALYRDELTPAGLAEIERFVSEGGVYLGTCAGAYLVTGSPHRGVRLVPRVEGPQRYGRGLATVQLARGYEHLVTNVTGSIRLKYVNGPSLNVKRGSPAEVLATVTGYEALAPQPQDHPSRFEGPAIGSAAVVRAPYGSGSVVLFSPHPELSPGFEDFLSNTLIAELLQKRP